ncbi:hypothetical protein M569_07643 [Genlisea aurea]|uniref:Uncharacterized protein n=1 Tax=Genlisea aurea TaxID=192259 RepID=S8CKA6_9LAMI|nr:hypothetical protein M569_07643 [Genlisea aurea]
MALAVGMPYRLFAVLSVEFFSWVQRKIKGGGQRRHESESIICGGGSGLFSIGTFGNNNASSSSSSSVTQKQQQQQMKFSSEEEVLRELLSNEDDEIEKAIETILERCKEKENKRREVGAFSFLIKRLLISSKGVVFGPENTATAFQFHEKLLRRLISNKLYKKSIEKKKKKKKIEEEESRWDRTDSEYKC